MDFCCALGFSIVMIPFHSIIHIVYNTIHTLSIVVFWCHLHFTQVVWSCRILKVPINQVRTCRPNCNWTCRPNCNWKRRLNCNGNVGQTAIFTIDNDDFCTEFDKVCHYKSSIQLVNLRLHRREIATIRPGDVLSDKSKMVCLFLCVIDYAKGGTSTSY